MFDNMETKKKKYTINIDESVIDMAKKIAKQSKRSLSGHIELLLEQNNKSNK